MQVGEKMKPITTFLNPDAPSVFGALYTIIKDNPPKRFENHIISFRCSDGEDVIEFRFCDIQAIIFEKHYIRVDFDNTGIWITLYDNINDIWIEKNNIDDEQQTLF